MGEMDAGQLEACKARAKQWFEALRDDIERGCSVSDWQQAVLVYHDLSTRTLPLLPGATWLGIASLLPQVMTCAVLTAAHAGSHRLQYPNNPRDYLADKVWICEATSGEYVGAKLKLVKPASDESIEFVGKNAPGVILFDKKDKADAA